MELTYGRPDAGRSFVCETCPANIQKLRRCREDREDFEFEKDGMPWPIYVQKGGDLYGFCPAKARWDLRTVGVFNMLIVVAETGQLPYQGGVLDQPDWMIEILGWFLPLFDMIKFTQKATMILGDGSSKSSSEISEIKKKFSTPKR